jgi:hypothetical protein
VNPLTFTGFGACTWLSFSTANGQTIISTLTALHGQCRQQLMEGKALPQPNHACALHPASCNKPPSRHIGMQLSQGTAAELLLLKGEAQPYVLLSCYTQAKDDDAWLFLACHTQQQDLQGLISFHCICKSQELHYPLACRQTHNCDMIPDSMCTHSSLLIAR